MRKIGMTAATLALAAVASAVPATMAQAQGTTLRGPVCNALWDGPTGHVIAYRDVDCGGLLGYTTGDDANWADNSGAFRGSDNDAASSVMNAGFSGAGVESAVAFYRSAGYVGSTGYGCLSAGEKYADWLGDNNYYPPGNGTLENSISSHQWVYNTACSGSSWIT